MWYSSIFRKTAEKIQVSLQSDYNNRYFTWSRPIYCIQFWSYLAQLFLEFKIFQTKVVQKLKTHILCSITFFLKLCRLWYNVENAADRGRPQKAIWRMCTACWLPKATYTRPGCVILIASPLQQRMHERASTLRYTDAAFLVVPQ